MAKYNHQTDNLANRLDKEEVRNVVNQILKVDDDYQKRILETDFEENINKVNCNPDEQFCGVGISTCCMVSNGNVYPCPGWQGYVCGNLKNNSLKEIWYLSKEMNYLRSLKKKDIPECLDCEDKAFCHPCLGRFANESKTGNPLEVAHHFCEVAKVNKEVVIDWRNKAMKELDNLKNKIIQEFKRKSMKAEYVWSEKEILSFTADLLSFEKSIFDDAINSLIKDEILIMHKNGLQLTKKGEKIIY